MVGLRRCLFVVAIVALAGLLGAQTAAANWEQQDTAALGGASMWNFDAVSCTAGTFCMAVGNFTSGGGGGLLAESRSGNSWTPQTPPNVTGNAEALNAISCRSASACVAVGSYFDGTNTVTLAEVWNGSNWSIENPPNPTGAHSSALSGISCTSGTQCMAVGSSDSATLAESWNGSTWTIQNTPNPSGETTAALNGVSCASATACTAVGLGSTGPNSITLAEVWNGTSWTIQSTPNSTTFGRLNAVSCTSSTNCMAVGQKVAERWDGTSWSLENLPTWPGASSGDPDLTGVSCKSATSCEASGSYFPDAVLTATAAQWDGTKWHHQSTELNTSNDSSALDGISCTSTTACTAVGSYHDPTTGNRALAEVFALRWQPLATAVPSGSIASSLDTVSCASARACSAIGNYETSSDFESLGEKWDGLGWSITSTPNPTNSNLSGVSCHGATACTAVGDVFNGGTLGTLAERWDGTSWTVQSAPNPAGSTGSFLLSVSCPSATACVAVGFYRDGSSNQHTLAEAWDGTTWSLKSTPDPSGSSIQLNGVSCTSATACHAVGSTSAGIFAEQWNGASWTIESTPLPVGGSGGNLAGVSCVSAGSCIAVGGYFNGSKTVPLAEAWNGTSWSAQTPPVPVGASVSSGFKSVSCKTTTFCVGVGFKDGNSGFRPMGERWNGAVWTSQSVPLVSGALSGYLTGVSCPAAFLCEGVGLFNDFSNTETILAEQLS